jgi:hypothetical protein
MSIKCDVILRGTATPDQLTALGAALWRWCIGAAGDTGIYQHLDNQALADLIAGKLPMSSQPWWPDNGHGVHLPVRDEVSQDRQTTIDSLRRSIPAEGVADIVVDGMSWNRIEGAPHSSLSPRGEGGVRRPGTA